MKEVRVVFVGFLLISAVSLTGCAYPVLMGASILANAAAGGAISSWASGNVADKCLDIEESKMTDREKRVEMAKNNCDKVGITLK